MEAALADAQTVVANRRRRVVTSSPVILTCGISVAGRSAACCNSALSLLKNCSIGLRSGEYEVKYSTDAP